MKRLLFFGVLSVCLIGASPLDAKVDAMFARWHAGTPGVVIAAEKDGRVVLERAYGTADLRFGVAMQTYDRFNTGSIAKQFTAFAVYSLVASGQISNVDDPVGKYVPGLSTMMGSISLRNLLEQTSGIRDYFALAQMSGVTLEDSIDTAQVLRLANAQEATDFRPGTGYEYSNTNYVLLAEAVRHVTGLPLGDYLQTHVFSPLHMNDTQLVSVHGTPLKDLVSSYWPSGSNGYVERTPLLDVQGDGNLITTAADLLRWEDNLDTRTFGRSVIERMLDRGALPGPRPASDRYVNGLFVERYAGYDRLSADGGIAGFRALAATFPKKRVSVVAFSNLIVTFPQEEVDAIAADLLGVQRPVAETPIALTTPPAEAAGVSAYVGRYAGAEIDSTYSVCAENGRLVVRTLRNPPIPLIHIGGDRFSGNVWWLSDVRFLRNADRVTQLSISGRSAQGVRLDRVSDSCSG